MKALFPGTFDPITNGHLDIIQRTAKVFDEVVVGVYRRPRKTPLFSAAERAAMVEQAVAGLRRVTVTEYDGLTLRFAKRIGAKVLVRGLRALSDFEYEFSIAAMNQSIDPNIETVCLLTATEHAFVSSSLIKEVAALGQLIDEWVPPNVVDTIRAKLAVDSSGISIRE